MVTKESLKKINHYDLIDILKVYVQEQSTDCDEYPLVYSEVIRRMVNGERAERGIGAMTPEEEKEFGF